MRTRPSRAQIAEEDRTQLKHQRDFRAAAKDVPGYRIQQHTRHASAEMVSRYVREADKWAKSGLKGVGF